MPKLRDLSSLGPSITVDAARWYSENRVPVAFRHLPPKVIRQAYRLAGGDWRRCVTDDDGQIVVYNHPMWTPE